jgi:hypothetical protein
MNELELNAIFDIVADPVKNAYKVTKPRDLDEIHRMIKVFNLVNAQKADCAKISARGLVAFKMLVSNN